MISNGIQCVCDANQRNTFNSSTTGGGDFGDDKLLQKLPRATLFLGDHRARIENHKEL